MTILADFNKMVQSGKLPMFEFELLNGDFLIVNIYMDDEYIYFNFDQEKETFFDGNIYGSNGSYGYEYSEEWDTLDSLLSLVYANITDGYIGSNGIQLLTTGLDVLFQPYTNKTETIKMRFNTLGEALKATGIENLPMIFGSVSYGGQLRMAHSGVFVSVCRFCDGQYEEAIVYKTEMEDFIKIT